jgi:hypothetical protein
VNHQYISVKLSANRVGEEPIYAQKSQGLVLGLISIIALLAGTLQNIILTYFPVGPGQYLDDVVVIILVVLSTLRWGNAKARPAILIIFWTLALVLAFYRTNSLGLLLNADTFVLFRQVFIPAALIMVGLVLSKREWWLIVRTAIFLGLANSAYILLEILGVRLIDPGILGHYHGIYVASDGLPGYYHGIWFDGSPMIRAGGLLLNPPTTGIVVATAMVLCFFLLKSRWRIPLVITMAITLGFTGSRAGMLIGFISIIFPVLAKRIGSLTASLLVSIPVIATGIEVMQLGGSASHVEGLIGGLRDAMNYPTGRGFSYVGNHAATVGIAESSESLLGIAFSAAGIITVAITLILVCKLLGTFYINPGSWLSTLSLGIVVAAMLSETAGAVNGTVSLWLFVGCAIAGLQYPKYAPTRNNKTKTR